VLSIFRRIRRTFIQFKASLMARRKLQTDPIKRAGYSKGYCKIVISKHSDRNPKGNIYIQECAQIIEYFLRRFFLNTLAPK